MVASDGALATSYRLSIVTICFHIFSGLAAIFSVKFQATKVTTSRKR